MERNLSGWSFFKEVVRLGAARGWGETVHERKLSKGVQSTGNCPGGNCQGETVKGKLSRRKTSGHWPLLLL